MTQIGPSPCRQKTGIKKYFHAKAVYEWHQTGGKDTECFAALRQETPGGLGEKKIFS